MPLASPAHGSVCQELAATCGQREAPLGSTLSGAWLGGARVGRSCLRGLTRQYCHSRDRCRFPSRLWSQPAPKGNSRTFIPNRVLGPDMIRRFRGRPNASSKVGLVEYVSNSHYGFARICERSESTRATSRNANAGRVSLPRSNAERTDGESTSSRSCKTIISKMGWGRFWHNRLLASFRDWTRTRSELVQDNAARTPAFPTSPVHGAGRGLSAR